jgi:tRNA pseudouridine38-40 synthase
MRSLVLGGVGGHCHPRGTSRAALSCWPPPPLLPPLVARAAVAAAAASRPHVTQATAADTPSATAPSPPPEQPAWRYDPDPSSRPPLDLELLRAAAGPGWWPLPGLDDSGEHQQQHDNNNKKRAVALHVAYLGTPFRGSQLLRDPLLGPQATAELTVEGALERALLRCGAVAPSNYGDLRRLGWSRASRTDKGVHSLGTVVGLRALVDESRFDNDPEGLWLADRVNEALALPARPGGAGGAAGAAADATSPPPPPPILVLSAQRVTKRFDCRRWAVGRSYEYYLPASALGLEIATSSGEGGREEGQQGDDDDHRRRGPVPLTQEQAAVVARFKGALAALEGHHAFHNYAGRRKQYSSTPAKEAARAAVPTLRERVAARRRRDEEEAAARRRSAGEVSGSSSPSPSSSASTWSSVDGEDDEEEGGNNNNNSSSSSSSAGPFALSAAAAAAPPPPARRRLEPFERRCWFLEQPDPADPVSAAHYRTVTRFAVVPWGAADEEEEAGSGSSRASSDNSDDTPPGDVVRLVDGGVPCLRIRVEGASFMLNQIRNMVGSAVACARGQLPRALLDASLSSRVRAALVKAPPHTLVLADTAFSPFATAYGTASASASAAGDAPSAAVAETGVSRWSGERLELRAAGKARQARWRRDVLAPAVQELLLHEDWRAWAEEELPRLSWPAAEEVARKDAEWQVVERRRKAEKQRKLRQQQQEDEARAGGGGGSVAGGLFAWLKATFFGGRSE